MEPQSTQNTQMDNVADRVDLLSKQIIILVELKVTKGVDQIHQAQCLNYLKAAGLPLCLLLNFGSPRLEIKRFVRGL